MKIKFIYIQTIVLLFYANIILIMLNLTFFLKQLWQNRNTIHTIM